MTLLGTAAITSTTGNLTFGAIDGAFSLGLSAPAGSVSIGTVGAITPLAALSVDPAGITLTGTLYETTGSQAFGSAVVLATDVAVISDTGVVTFQSTVDGVYGLSVTASSGSAEFDGNVGAATALTSLGVTAGSITLGASTIHTSGGQDFAGVVALIGNLSAVSDSSGIRFEGAINGAHSLSVQASGSSIAEFDGSVGATTALTTFDVSGGTIDLGAGTVRSTSSQTYSNVIVLISNDTLLAGSGAIAFGSTVDGAFTLSFSNSGGLTVTGPIGAGTPLAALTIANTSGGAIVLPEIHTTGAASLSATGKLTLSVPSTFQSLTASGSTVALGGVATAGGIQVYTGVVEIAGTYTTSGGNFTINGPAQLTGATTIDPGAGTLTITGSIAGTSNNLAILGSGIDGFGSNLDLGAGTLDLSSKTAGSVTVQGAVNLAALNTGESNYAISFLGGGSIGDPIFANTGGVTFAGDFLFTGGLTVGALALAGGTSISGETSGVTLGTVNQGGNQFVVIADTISLTGAWTGTGNRAVAAFSPIGIGLAGAGSPGDLQLDQTELGFLANGGTAPVLIGSGLNGAITANSFTFDAPLTLVGASITINGTLSKSMGGLVLEAVQAVNNTLTLGAISGAVSLAGGTGPLSVQAASVTLTNSTVNGDSGATSSIVNQMQFITPPTPGPGPYTVDGFDFSPSQTPTLTPGNPPPEIAPVLVPPTNPNLNNSNPNTTTIEEINLVIQTSTGAGPGTAEGGTQGSTDTGTTGTGTLADQTGGQIAGGSAGGTPGPTPSSSGNAKPIMPNLFLHTNTGLGGGTDGAAGAGGTLGNPPSQ